MCLGGWGRILHPGDQKQRNKLREPPPPPTRWLSMIGWGLPARFAIFRQKNYSAKFGTSRNWRQFRRNSASFAAEKNLGIPFRTISRKRKTLGIPSRIISRKKNTIGIPFRITSRKRKTIGIPFRTIFRKRKPIGIPFQTIFGWE